MTSLQVLRKAKSLTQEQLAERLNVNRTTVTMWETGANTPPTRYLLPLAAILECSVEDILREQESS